MAVNDRPRAGEEWRTPEGRLIYVESVEVDGVMGNATAPAYTSSGQLTSSDSMAHYGGRVADFAQYELIGPRWAITFTAPVLGEHPTQDPLFAAVNAVANVQHREVGTVISGAIHQGAKYDVIVVGLTVEEATEKLKGAVRDHGELTVVSAHRAL